jgi:Asp-tRNA(Asn)/Glu-tRNA(Gln) amidotransferase A subunit family amidase
MPFDAESTPDRRHFLSVCATVGAAGTLFPGVLWARAATGEEITVASVAAAEEIAGVTFTDAQRTQLLRGLKAQSANIATLHGVLLDNSVAPAVMFTTPPPLVSTAGSRQKGGSRGFTPRRNTMRVARPTDAASIAFMGLDDLATLIATKQISARELLDVYLERITRLDPKLQAVITVTETRARAQAARLDDETAKGKSRGPLHGIPWGAKDLLAVNGYKTTWGSGAHRDQVIARDATVVQRLDDAGAVLLAKLTLGELAQGDIWFGGTTKNPWNLSQGSSGSSAGPASAVSAALVAFAIGSETLGSISSPSTRCGVVGLRPTFGRVPRTGAMALSWSMDKLGPICRRAADCATVLSAVAGIADPGDLSSHTAPFAWTERDRPLRDLRIGYVQSTFDAPERDPADATRITRPNKAFDDNALAMLRREGATLIPVTLPDLPYAAMRIILTAEAGAAFDELTRTGRDALLVQQGDNAWPNTFRTTRFIPATDYINANRVRTLAIEQWNKMFEQVDVIVTPTNGNQQLQATNLTGHPAVIMPHGFRATSTTDSTLVPQSITILGGLWKEGSALAVAHALEHALGLASKRPPVE